MAGIPDICNRSKNVNIPYEESWFDMEENKVSIMKKLSHKVFNELQGIGCKVVFVPMTTMNIRIWNTHRIKVRKTKILKNASKYEKMQVALNKTIHEMNNYIIEVNTKNHMVPPFIESFVHTSSASKVKYSYSQLIDGVHPSDELLLQWLRKLNKTMLENHSIQTCEPKFPY